MAGKKQPSSRPDISIRIYQDKSNKGQRHPFTASVTFYNGMEEMIEGMYVGLRQNASGRLYFEKSNADSGGVRLDAKYHRIQTARVELVKLLSVWEGDYDLEQDNDGPCFIRMSARKPIPGQPDSASPAAQAAREQLFQDNKPSRPAPEPEPKPKPKEPEAPAVDTEEAEREINEAIERRFREEQAYDARFAELDAAGGTPESQAQTDKKEDSPVENPVDNVEKKQDSERLVTMKFLARRLVSQIDQTNTNAVATASMLLQLLEEGF